MSKHRLTSDYHINQKVRFMDHRGDLLRIRGNEVIVVGSTGRELELGDAFAA